MRRKSYDDENIFAKILRGEIPCNKVDECETTLTFHDIQPQAELHVLIISKGAYVDMDDFSAHASDAEKAGLMAAVGRVSHKLGMAENGYRLITNIGAFGYQEVPHLHFHLLGGEPIGPLRAR